MDSIISSYAFWILTVIHISTATELIYFKIHHKFHSRQIFNVSPKQDNNKTEAIPVDTVDLTYNPYMAFPNMSSKTLIRALKVLTN